MIKLYRTQHEPVPKLTIILKEVHSTLFTGNVIVVGYFIGHSYHYNKNETSN